MSNNILEELAKALTPVMEQQKARQFGLSMGFKHDASGTPISTGYSHGPNGLLTFPGVDNTVFHTVMGHTSIIGQLPAVASVYTNPTYFTITGVQDDVGNEKDEECDDAPTAGLMKGCMLTSVFGRYERATPELEINRLGQRVDRADPLDLALVGSPIASAGIFNTGTQSAAAPGDVLVNEVSRKFWERNISLWRLLSRQIWNGTPANNSAGGGYKEMTGLSTLINTGHVDAETGQACPALDSIISNFAYGSVSSSGTNIVAALVALYHEAYRRAELTGVLPVRWVLVMRSQLFYEISAVWPCAYLSYRCNLNGTSATEFIDAQDAVRFRDEMRAGRYLLIDGQRVEVVLDDGITELDGNSSGGQFPAGCFSSDIYLLPMSVVGGRSVTFLEYFDYGNPSINSALGDSMIMGRTEGAFLTWTRQTNTCIVWQTKVEPRLVLRTPWLAGRLQNVVYCPVIHERTSFPGDPYFVNGGKTYRADGPSFYSLWQS